MPDWRSLDPETRQKWMADVVRSLQERATLGKLQYGETFQGDPLLHAWNELLDGLLYIWVAMRQRETIRLSNSDKER